MPAIQIGTAAAAFVANVNDVLAERDDDNFKVIPSTYGSLYNSLEPGVVAGIVIGSVAAFLLLLFICYSALGFGPPIFSRTEGSVVQVRVRRGTSRASHSSRRTSRHTRSPKRRGGPSIVSADSYEVRTYERVHVVPPPAPPHHGHGRGPVIVDAAPSSAQTLTTISDSEEDDEVVVIEESSTPPRRRRDRSYDRRRRSPSLD